MTDYLIAQARELRAENQRLQANVTSLHELADHYDQEIFASHEERDQLRAERDEMFRRLANQEKFNIDSRRSLCEQSDRYKAERDAARAELTKGES